MLEAEVVPDLVAGNRQFEGPVEPGLRRVAANARRAPEATGMRRKGVGVARAGGEVDPCRWSGLPGIGRKFVYIADGAGEGDGVRAEAVAGAPRLVIRHPN